MNHKRHEHIIAELRKAGVHIKLINDGDIAGAVNTVFDKTGINILFRYCPFFVDGRHSLNKKPNLVIKP